MTDGQKLIAGICVPFRGLAIILSNVRFLAYSAVPCFISFCISLYAFYLAVGSTGSWLTSLYSKVPILGTIIDYTTIGDFEVAGFIVKMFAFLALFVIAAYLSYVLISIIGAPFYSLISEGVLKSNQLRPFNANSFKQWARVTGKMLLASVFKMLIFICLASLLFLVAFFPIIFAIVPIFLSLMVAYDCMDYSFECMTMNLSQRFAFFQRNLFAFLGIGLSVTLAGFVPFLFTLLLPIFIAGAAELFCKLHRSENERAAA